MSEEKFTVPRTDWLPGGAWDHEDDFEEFTASDLTCVLIRSKFGHWEGYVALPDKHPWTKKQPTSISASVYGGVKSVGAIPDYTGTFVGFACNEPGDLQPTMMKWKREHLDSGIYRNFAFAKAETEKLAASVKAAVK